jgi:hypothetical protein
MLAKRNGNILVLSIYGEQYFKQVELEIKEDDIENQSVEVEYPDKTILYFKKLALYTDLYYLDSFVRPFDDDPLV